ncbi:phosphonopyruvate decarboxylase [Acidovorax temperans]|uniref:phosphonopyruvate decarboxylase n=1 Tax=Acidovorax temperans TaxID=80878 RepID=UPI0035AEAB56
MLDCNWFLNELMRQGVSSISGVPCSYVAGLYSLLEQGDWPYFPATSEGESVAIAAGSWLGGKQGIAFCQNSGMGNMVNPLTSLVEPFQIPVLLGVSRRGWPAEKDESQHALMGRITPGLLEMCNLQTHTLPRDAHECSARIEQAMHAAGDRVSTAFVIEKGSFSESAGGAAAATPALAAQVSSDAQILEYHAGAEAVRGNVLRTCLDLEAHRPTIATTGYTGRELYALDNRPHHFYMTGSMGCAPAIGIGLVSSSGLPVTVLDGDGALLMRMGIMASVARHVRTSFAHILLDNGVHESTGRQLTNGAAVNFPLIAKACGYHKVWNASGVDGINQALREAMQAKDGPVFVRCKIAPHAPDKLPRPSQTLPELALRMREANLALISKLQHQ